MKKELIVDYNMDTNLKISVQDQATVAIGQNFMLEITYTSPSGPLSHLFKMTVIPKLGQQGLKIVPVSDSDLTGQESTYTKKVYCIIEDTVLSTSTGTKLSYVIKYGNPGATPKTETITYIAKELGKYSLQLKTNQSVCITPDTDAPFSNTLGSYISYSTKLVDKNTGDPFKYTPFNVYSLIPNDINEDHGKVSITNDPSGSITPTLIPLDMNGNRPTLSLTTDVNGDVSFRVYPKKDTPASLTLVSNISGLGPTGDLNIRTAAIYMITPPPEYNLNPPPFPPNIQSPYGSIVIGKDGQNTFEAEVMPYSNLNPSDKILFFSKSNNGAPDPNGLVLPIKSLSEAGLNSNQNYNFDIPYSMFNEDVLSYLYYVVASEAGNIQYSGTTAFTYKGGGDKIPSNNVNRLYNKVTVFNSFVDYKNDPLLSSNGSKIHEILEESSVNYHDISNYANNGSKDPSAGLFLKIVASNDPNDTDYPQVQTGINVHANIYIKSGSQNFKNPTTIHKKLSFTPDKPGGKHCTTIIPVDYTLLQGIPSYENGDHAWIYIEYYTIDVQSNEKIYSKYWQDIIETTITNG
ncbi:hypothetical protein [Xenorhabdus sp. PB30.3]|uniref:hypothetical protein n=1 Tax=Xenorhabdus sp. PB30.3 TaxID=2788941 RepID=UPI001E5493C1|nr:hypothetical protein [Xenorhabdus sp. PB30.3]MCC8381744.1 hypothetical protein [Xenorhabdus sp. PB30.3]